MAIYCMYFIFLQHKWFFFTIWMNWKAEHRHYVFYKMLVFVFFFNIYLSTQCWDPYSWLSSVHHSLPTEYNVACKHCSPRWFLPAYIMYCMWACQSHNDRLITLRSSLRRPMEEKHFKKAINLIREACEYKVFSTYQVG